MSDWISAKDRLPEIAGDYLVWIDGTDTADCTPGPRCPFYFWKNHGQFRSDVTHWQPLPDGPESETR